MSMTDPIRSNLYNAGIRPGYELLDAFKPFATIPLWAGWKLSWPKQRGRFDPDKPNARQEPYKVPLIPGGRTEKLGEFSSSTDPAKWGTFADAIKTHGTKGVMLAIGPKAQEVARSNRAELIVGCLDFDNALDDSGNLLPWAAELIQRCRSLAELSVTDGAHVYFTFDPSLRRKKYDLERPDGGKIEVFTGGEDYFIVLNGKPLNDLPLADLSDILRELHVEHDASAKHPHSTRENREAKRTRGPYDVETGKLLMPGYGKGFDLPQDIIAFVEQPQAHNRSEGLCKVILSMYRHFWPFDRAHEYLKKHQSGVAGHCDGDPDKLTRQIIRAIQKFALPIVFYAANRYQHAVDEVEQIVLNSDEDIYYHYGFLKAPTTRPVKDRTGKEVQALRLVAIEWRRMRKIVDGCAEIKQWTEDGLVDASLNVKKEIAIEICERAIEGPFPTVIGVWGCQTMRKDGTIVTDDGYDEITQRYYRNLPEMRAVSWDPTRREIARARYVLERPVRESTFDDDKKRGVNCGSQLASMMVLPLKPRLRHVPTPVISHIDSGGGKGTLCDIIAYLGTGFTCLALGVNPYKRGDIGNKLVGLIQSGNPCGSLDNLNDMLMNDEALQRYKSEDRFSERSFFKQDAPEYEDRPFLMETGNNMRSSRDEVRRDLPIKLRQKQDAEIVWLSEWVGDPIGELGMARGKYLWAIFTLCRGFDRAIERGEVQYIRPALAGFKEWNDHVRSLVVWIGYDDPVLGMVEAKSVDDTQTIDEQRIWAAVIGVNVEVDAPELGMLIQGLPELRSAFYAYGLTKGVFSTTRLVNSYLQKHKTKTAEYQWQYTKARKRRRSKTNPTQAWVLLSCKEVVGTMTEAEQDAKVGALLARAEKNLKAGIGSWSGLGSKSSPGSNGSGEIGRADKAARKGLI